MNHVAYLLSMRNLRAFNAFRVLFPSLQKTGSYPSLFPFGNIARFTHLSIRHWTFGDFFIYFLAAMNMSHIHTAHGCALREALCTV